MKFSYQLEGGSNGKTYSFEDPNISEGMYSFIRERLHQLEQDIVAREAFMRLKVLHAGAVVDVHPEFESVFQKHFMDILA